MFFIELSNETHNYYGELSYRGTIHLPGRVEYFFAPAVYWDREDYVAQWRDSFLKGLTTKTHSALVTSMYDPAVANFLTIWVLYYGVDKIFLQNKIIFMEEIIGKFDEENINRYVGSREIINEDGDRISEWNFSYEEVLSFFENDLIADAGKASRHTPN